MKKAFTNPAIYAIYIIYAISTLIFFIGDGYQNSLNPIPVSIFLLSILLIISYYFLRPLYPIKFKGDKVIIYTNFLVRRTITLQSIISVEKLNRYDRLTIVTSKRKITLFFLLRTKDLERTLKKRK